MAAKDESVTMGDEANLNPDLPDADDEGKAKPSADPVEVTLNGKTFKLDADAAAAVKEVQDAANKAGAEVAETNRKLAEALTASQPAKKAGDAPAAPDLGTLMFTDPDKFVQLLTSNILNVVAAQNQQTNAQKEFWTAFYEKNPDLKDADVLVKATMQSEYANLRPLTVEKAIEKLADSVQGQLLKITKGTKGTKKPNPVEGGNNKGGRRSNDSTTDGDAPESKPGGISSVLKQRAEARRKARTGA